MEAFLLYILKSGICLVVFYVSFPNGKGPRMRRQLPAGATMAKPGEDQKIRCQTASRCKSKSLKCRAMGSGPTASPSDHSGTDGSLL